MNLHGLFAQPVGFFDLGRPLSDEEKFFLMELEQRPNMGNRTSANNFVLRDKLMTSLRGWMEDCVAEYFKATTNPKHDVTLRLTQSWVNYSEPGQYHHKHAHPNSFLSGCFYPQADKELDKLYFFNEPYHRIKIHSEDFNVYNSDSWWLPVGTGDIVIFPSSLTHMVEQVVASNTRISLSFNTFPVGYVGNDDSLTGLHL